MSLDYTPPTGWRYPTIEEIAAPEKGAIRIGPFGSALKKHEFSESGVRVLGIEDVFPNKLVSERIKYIPIQKYSELSQYTVRCGDILVTNMGTVGRTCVVPDELEKSIISSHLIKISLDKNIAFPSYISWMLNYCPLVVAQIKSKCHGAIMAGFNSGLLKQLQIPLPPLPEQRRIAEVLDRAEALRAKRRAALAEFDRLSQTIFIDMFGDPAINPNSWPIKTLGKLAIKISDGPFGSNLKSSHYTETGVRVIRLQNIGIGEFIDDNRAFISANHFASLKKHECLPGDVLVGTLGDPNLRACIQPIWLPVALNKADCVQIRPDEETANSAYVCALLNQPATERMAQELILGQTRLRISMGRLRGLNVPVPPISLQNEFSRRIAAVEKLKTAVRASLTELDALFASLQHLAFRGEL